MSSSQDPAFFAAQNDFSLIVARTAGKGRALVIQELREVALVDKAAIEEAMRAVFPSGAGAITAAALRPAEQLRLANADEGRRIATPAAVQKFARESAEFASLQPGLFAVAPAKEGAGSPWLLAATAAAAHSQMLASLAELQLKPARTAAASLHAATALVATLKARNTDAAVLCLDLGALNSHAMLVSRRGIEAAGPAAISLDAIAEAVQAELGLKFKGSAGKLFFNEAYDFSEAASKIAARLTPVIKTSISGLGGVSPTELYCAGLPAKQQWLANALAAELGLTACLPDLKTWCTSAGIAFANPIEAGVPPAWLGFLQFVSAQSGGAPGAVWSSEWIPFDATLAAAPAPVVAPPAVVAAAPVVAPAAVVAPPAPQPKAQPVAAFVPPLKAAPIPAAPTAAKPAAPPPPTTAKPAVAPMAKPAPALSKPAPSVSYPPKSPAANPVKPLTPPVRPTPTAKPTLGPVPPKPQPVPIPGKAAAVPIPALTARDEPGEKSKLWIFIGVAAVLAVLIGGFFFMRAKNAETERIAIAAREAQVASEKRIKEEAEKNRLVTEQKAREESEARKKTEGELTRKLAEAEAARQQAELNAKAQMAARLANARGSVVIRSDPPGATAVVGGLPARPTPATFGDIKIGKHPVTVSLPYHDDVKFEVEITENATTEPPTVRLTRITGTMEVTSDPAGANYEVRPANVLVVPPDARRTGQTPATLNDLAAGEYTVTISRDGWAPHTENITVGRNGTAKVAWAFQNGIVRISSTPEGATVTRNGTRLGVTPLTLSDQTPGDARFELSLPEHEPATLSGKVESGKTLSFTAPMLSVDRLAKQSELDVQPEIIPSSQTQPDVSDAIKARGGRVEIEFTVTRAGATKDFNILQSTNPAAEKACLAAAAKLKFKPGTIKGKPMNVRVRYPYVFTAPKG
ncbi:MAG: TonB family protein [Opitutaceae bacterium]